MAAMSDPALESGFAVPIPEECPLPHQDRGCITTDSRSSSSSTAPQISVANAYYKSNGFTDPAVSAEFGRASVDAMRTPAQEAMRAHVAPHPDHLTAPHPRKIERRLRMEYRDVYHGEVFFEKDWQVRAFM